MLPTATKMRRMGAAGILAAVVIATFAFFAVSCASAPAKSATAETASTSSTGAAGKSVAGALSGPFKLIGCPATGAARTETPMNLTFDGYIGGHADQTCGASSCGTEPDISAYQHQHTSFAVAQINFIGQRSGHNVGLVISISGWGNNPPPFTVQVGNQPVEPMHSSNAGMIGTGYATISQTAAAGPGFTNEGWRSTGGTITFTSGDHGTIDATFAGDGGTTVHVSGSFATKTPCTATGL